jgi:hypothetical protein
MTRGVTTAKIVVFALGMAVLITALTFLPERKPAIWFWPGSTGTKALTAFHPDKPLPLEFGPREVDFGEVQGGKHMDASFTFRNPTDEWVKGITLHASCGCTSVLLSAPDCPPGGTGKIKTTLNTTGFSGLIEKTIDVTAKSEKGLTRLRLKAIVVPTVEVRVTPHSVLFDDVPEGAGALARFTVTNVGRHWLYVKEVRTTSPRLEAKTVGPGMRRDSELEVTLKPGLAAGVHHASIAVYLHDRVLPYVLVPVKIVVVPKP